MKPFLQGKKHLEAVSLSRLQAHQKAPRAAPTAATPAHEPAHGPVVEVIKEGDRVVRLVVTCSCGEHIEIDCLYPAGV